MKHSIRVPLIDLSAQNGPIEAEVKAAIGAVVRRGDFVLGEEVRLFEEEFARYCDTRYAVGVDSGSSALELALRAHGIGPGDEVITAANTFVATAFAISSCGALPVLVDIDPRTCTIDVDHIEDRITARTRAIIPVHLYGHPADMDPLCALARRRGLVVIEDACQAHGARYRGRRVGSLGDAAAFSFYPAKNLGAFGDGGMVTTRDEKIYEAIRSLRDYGQREKYRHDLRGYNRRLDTIQAAVLRIKLRLLDAGNAARRRHAQRYGERLAEAPIQLPVADPYAEPVYHLYVIRTEQRDRLRRALARRGIGTGMHYPIPIHRQEAYRDLCYREGAFPVTEAYARQLLSLPLYPELTPELIDHVAGAVTEGFRDEAPACAADESGPEGCRE